MKRLVYIGLTVAVGYWLVKTFFFARTPDRLDAHLTEQSNLQKLGKLTGNVNIAARPALSVIGARPGDGAIVTPFTAPYNVESSAWYPSATGQSTAHLNWVDMLRDN